MDNMTGQGREGATRSPSQVRGNVRSAARTREPLIRTADQRNEPPGPNISSAFHPKPQLSGSARRARRESRQVIDMLPQQSSCSIVVERAQPVRWRLCWLLVVLACFGVLALCPQAFADSAAISVTNTAGQSDPAAGVPRVFTVSGVALVPEKVFVKHRATGGAQCGPSAESDSGGDVDSIEGYGIAYGSDVNGAFSIKGVVNWGSPGTEMFCIWLAKDEGAIATPIAQNVTFRSPTGTITGSVNPVTPAPGQQTTVTISGSSEAPAKVYAKIRPAGGAGCAPTYEAESAEQLVDDRAVNGSFSVQATTTQSKAGQYLICMWLGSSPSDTSPIAGPQPVTFTVASPPPPPPPPAPCIVPAFSSRMHLSTVERRIRAGHCSVGKIYYTASRRVRRGAVIRLGDKPGSELSPRAAVAIVVSTGYPKRHGRRRSRH
jgi:hypothetical protein